MSIFTNITAENIRVNDIIRILVPNLRDRSGDTFVHEIVQVTSVVTHQTMHGKTFEITFMSHAGEQTRYEPAWFPIQRWRSDQTPSLACSPCGLGS
jgi:hypothetical protein